MLIGPTDKNQGIPGSNPGRVDFSPSSVYCIIFVASQ